MGMEQGTPFALAHTFFQTGPFRPNNVNKKVPGLVFTGSSTLPGVGVPMVLVSGKLAAQRVEQYARRAADGERSAVVAQPRDPADADHPVAPDRAGHPRRELRAVPRVQQAPRHHVLLVHQGPVEGEAASRARVVRVRPIRRRHRRRDPVAGRARRADQGCAAAALADFGDRFFADLDVGRSDDPVLKAVVHTVRAFDIDTEAFHRFLRSMTMDLTVESYRTWDDLLGVHGRLIAAVIGEMMLPILEPIDYDAALPHARDLGNAFQLTNFLRDIDEDLDRGRQYIPLDDSDRFGVDLTQRSVTPEFVALMRFEIDRCRAGLYRSAQIGIDMLPDRSAKCVGAAHALYGRILDKIEAQDYDVFTSRASVSTAEKATMVARLLSPFS